MDFAQGVLRAKLYESGNAHATQITAAIQQKPSDKSPQVKIIDVSCKPCEGNMPVSGEAPCFY
jgi:hypothetical protein